MRKITNKDLVTIYVKPELKEDFKKKLNSHGDMSEIIRGCMMLYIDNTVFRKQVDDFVETHKTI